MYEQKMEEQKNFRWVGKGKKSFFLEVIEDVFFGSILIVIGDLVVEDFIDEEKVIE